MNYIKPKAIKLGDTIGIVSPGEWLDDARFNKGLKTLESLGFKYKTMAAFEMNHRLAGSDEERAGAINAMFADPEVDAIMCTRGGTGSFRTLDYLDHDVIRENPKIFVGYSDITLLLHHMHKQTGLMTFHGPMLTSLQGNNPFTTEHFVEAATGGTPTLELIGGKTLVHGVAEGELIGGNLNILTTLLGTPDSFDTDGKILFIEDIDEAPYTIDRMMWHLHRAGKLANIRGLIVGEMIDIRENHPNNPYGHPIEEVLEELLPVGVPCVTNAPCGHGSNLATFPLGLSVRLDVGTEAPGAISLTFLEPAVI